MDAMPLTTRVDDGPSGPTIHMTGRLDRDGDAAMADAYSRATADDARTVRLDFAGVDYMNSTGIALVVRILAEARRDGRTVEAVGLSEHYREIFRITRLSDFVVMIDDPAAVAAGNDGANGQSGVVR